MRWGVLLLLLLAGCQSPEEGGVIRGGNLLLDPSHGGGGAAWGLAECGSCHALGVIHANAGGIAPLVRRLGYATCGGCHGDNGTGRARRCTICHNPDHLPDAPLSGGAHSHDFRETPVSTLGDEACLVCHVASDMDGRFEPDRDLTPLPDAGGLLSRYRTIADFCLRCHNRDHPQPGFEMAVSPDDPRVAIEAAWYHTDEHGRVDGSGTRTYAGLRPGYRYRTEVACTDCHAMHGTGNPGLLIDDSRKGVSRLDPALREQPYRVRVREGDYAQLCVLCHAMETPLEAAEEDTGNGLSGVHAQGVDCRPCHRHGEAVQAGL